MKNFLFVLTLLFSLATFSQSPVDKSFPPEELFALGSYYYPEQWDSSQWERGFEENVGNGHQIHPFCRVRLVYDGTGRGRISF